MASKETMDTRNTAPTRPAESLPEEESADLAELTANRPLKILNDVRGTDPYNHTGRFSKPTKD